MADNQPPVPANISIRSRALGHMPRTVDQLKSRATQSRKDALADAVDSFRRGAVPRPHETGWPNLLARTFFSYSAEGLSPSLLAWEAVIRGLSHIGCCDADNLGALDEMLAAGDELGIRATVSLETKCFAPSHAGRDIGFPGQNGFLRAIGLGFTSIPPLDSDHGRLIGGLPGQARVRNRARIERINPLLSPVRIGYEEDVLPLTLAGNATPDHVALAYVLKAESVFPGKEDRAVFWADVLGCSPMDAERLLADLPAFGEAVWDRFRRYTEEDRNPDNYPAVADFFKAVTASGAIPCVFRRDGGTGCEADAEGYLDAAAGWGARAVAVAPDAIWNVRDGEEKRARMERFDRLMRAARERAMPVVAGSFMERPGQKFVDSFDAPEIAGYFRDFSDAAFWVHGHAVLERAAGLGLGSEWAGREFGGDRAAANAFYRDAGKAAAPGKTARRRLAGIGSAPAPAEILACLKE